MFWNRIRMGPYTFDSRALIRTKMRIQALLVKIVPKSAYCYFVVQFVIFFSYVVKRYVGMDADVFLFQSLPFRVG
jgi:hypothetical protein